ncbi:MAG: hypothetical protein FJY74_03285 [Candidatus Eisenbacteria bacterium]|nr:hypothetical protein [Candidatus Eisenbacteria bacterium]
MRVLTVGCVLVALALSAAWADAALELRTWTTPAAAPATGAPVSSSTTFTMRSRLGGPFAGRATSTSFSLWGCSAYTPVEVAFFAVSAAPDCVTLRWSVSSLDDIAGFNVYRAPEFGGPYARVNDEVLPLASPSSYDDRSVWPGSEFWYELWAVRWDGSEERLTMDPVSVTTGGTLQTRLHALAPNPFTDQALIQFDVASVGAEVSLRIYDVAGRVVREMWPDCPRPGRYSVAWDGTNDRGGKVASGVYFCRLECGGVGDLQRVVVLR